MPIPVTDITAAIIILGDSFLFIIELIQITKILVQPRMNPALPVVVS